MISIHEQATQNGFSIGWITLNLPKTLNALTLDMATTALEQLRAWAERPDLACVVLQGEGRAFCAGGDVRRMREGILANDNYCAHFFEQEYRLDHALHNYPKPLLAWGHGIVMGGGLGLFMGDFPLFYFGISTPAVVVAALSLALIGFVRLWDRASETVYALPMANSLGDRGNEARLFCCLFALLAAS